MWHLKPPSQLKSMLCVLKSANCRSWSRHCHFTHEIHANVRPPQPANFRPANCVHNPHKTPLSAGTTSILGLPLPNVDLPFSLRNAAQTFQRFIDEVLHGLEFCYAYIDDLLIASSNCEEHIHHLKLVLERLSKHGVLINTAKSTIGVPALAFLGHHVDCTGIRPLEAKVQAVFLSPALVNFYRRAQLSCFNSTTELTPSHNYPQHKDPGLEDTAAAAFTKVKMHWLMLPFWCTQFLTHPHSSCKR